MEQSQTLLTIGEVCRELRISRSTLYRFLGNELPVHDMTSRAVRIDRADLEAFKRSRRRPLNGAPADHSAA